MPEPRFRKGDRVRFRFGSRSVGGEVKEDRGPIGMKGRRKDDLSGHIGKATDPNMDQSEVDMMFKPARVQL